MADASPNSGPAVSGALDASSPARGGRGGRGRGRGRGGRGSGRGAGAAMENVSAVAGGASTAGATRQAQQRQEGDASGNKKRKGEKRAGDGGAGAGAGVTGGEGNAEGESAQPGVEVHKRAKNEKKDKGPAKEQPSRPTHFLSLSMATDPTLRARLTAFGDALLAASPPIAGLDRSIVIDPRRVHLTLGVMRLEKEYAAASASSKDANADPPKKTTCTALALLRSLAPQLAALGPARVDLERLGVLKTQKGGREANVLWVGPRGAADSRSGGTEKSSLYAIADLVHQTFRREGYITETRPLKLHVTLLNTTHRKRPRRRLAFSYTDVLQSEAVKLLGAVLPGPAKAGDAEDPDAEAAMVKLAIANAEKAELDAEAQEQIAAGGDAIVPDAGARKEIARILADGEIDSATDPAGKSDVRVEVMEVDVPAAPDADVAASSAQATFVVPRHPIPISLGSYEVRAVHLCEMGSHGPDNEYVSVGCVEF